MRRFRALRRPVVMPGHPEHFLPERLNKVSSTATVSGDPAGSSRATRAWARPVRWDAPRVRTFCAVEPAFACSGVGRAAERLPGRYAVSVSVVCGETRGVRESPPRRNLGDGGLPGLGVRELVVSPIQPDAAQPLSG